MSLKNLSRVLWQTKVHRWEIELYQGMVLDGNMVDRGRADQGSGGSQDGYDQDGGEDRERRREGRKRRAANCDEEGTEVESEGDGVKQPSAKRQKAGELKQINRT